MAGQTLLQKRLRMEAEEEEHLDSPFLHMEPPAVPPWAEPSGSQPILDPGSPTGSAALPPPVHMQISRDSRPGKQCGTLTCITDLIFKTSQLSLLSLMQAPLPLSSASGKSVPPPSSSRWRSAAFPSQPAVKWSPRLSLVPTEDTHDAQPLRSPSGSYNPVSSLCCGSCPFSF